MEKGNGKIKLVIFDLDGVIVNSLGVMRLAFESSYREIINAYASDELIADYFREYRKHLGKGFKQIMKELELPLTMYEPFVKHSIYLAPYVHLYSGIQKMLELLKNAGLILTIATGKDGYRARMLLEQLKVKSYFSCVTGSDEIPAAKPAPDMIINHLNQFDMFPEDSIIIGDSPSDIQSGKNANVKTMAALWGYTSKEDIIMYQPDYLVDTPDDVVLKIAS
jgi:3-amino-5-hydroxybenzoic acid synthesis related protein